MKEIQASITSSLLNRTRSPFIGSFIFSWLIYNWKVPIHLLHVTALPSDRINAVQIIISDQDSYLIPLIFSIVYVLISPWLWLGIRVYTEMALDLSKQRDRKRNLEELGHRQEMEELEAKAMHLQRTKLQNREEIDKLREEINILFEQLSSNIEARFQSSADRLKKEAAKVEAEIIPALYQKIQQAKDQTKHTEAAINHSLQTLRKQVIEERRSANELAEKNLQIQQAQDSHLGKVCITLGGDQRM